MRVVRFLLLVMGMAATRAGLHQHLAAYMLYPPAGAQYPAAGIDHVVYGTGGPYVPPRPAVAYAPPPKPALGSRPKLAPRHAPLAWPTPPAKPSFCGRAPRGCAPRGCAGPRPRLHDGACPRGCDGAAASSAGRG